MNALFGLGGAEGLEPLTPTLPGSGMARSGRKDIGAASAGWSGRPPMFVALATRLPTPLTATTALEI
jgi:hypothetical protein